MRFLASVLLSAFVSLVAFSMPASAGEKPVTAALVYADWCASCKVLDPKIEAVRPQLEEMGVNVVRLDYTARDKEAFMTQAEGAGVRAALEAWTAKKVKTGQLLLINTSSNQLVGVVTKSFENDQIVGAARAAVTQAKLAP